jgi:hypothetical protein
MVRYTSMGRFIGVVVVGLAIACHSGEPLDWNEIAHSRGLHDDAGAVSNRVAPRDAGQASSDPPDAAEVNAPPTGVLATDSTNITPFAGRAALGASCQTHERCQSGHCSNGICCIRACSSCEACSNTGRCEPLAECSYPVCDAGLCVAGRSPLGLGCSDRSECESGFCVDGVCCESACDDLCQHCSEAGYCNQFPQTDPACPTVTCPDDLECRSYSSPLDHACSAVARCARQEDCVVHNVRAGSACSEGRRCDGFGECRLDGNGLLPAEPTQLCPAPGAGPSEVRVELDAPEGACWMGSSWDLGVTMAFGKMSTAFGGAGWTISAYLNGFAASAKTQAYDEAGRLLPGCVAVDVATDREWMNVTFSGATCVGAAFARVTAHASSNGDL